MEEKHFHAGEAVMFRYAPDSYGMSVVRGVSKKAGQYIIERFDNFFSKIDREAVKADCLFSLKDMDGLFHTAEKRFADLAGASLVGKCVALQDGRSNAGYSPAIVLSIEYDDEFAKLDKLTILRYRGYSDQILVEKTKVSLEDLMPITEENRETFKKEAFDVLKMMASLEQKLF